MKKALRVIALTAGIISVVSTVVLGFLYLEDAADKFLKIKTGVLDKFTKHKALPDDDEFDF